MGGDKFDGSFDLLGSCYFLLHVYSVVVCVRHLAVKEVVGDIYSRLAWWVKFARLWAGASGDVVFVRQVGGW